MKKLFVVVLMVVALSSVSWGQEQMTPSRFRKLVAKAGDNVPLNSQLSAVGPLWTNATIAISLQYNNGKSFSEEARQTVKTIEGKYIVTTITSDFYKQPMHSITAYDEKALSYKVWAMYGETIAESQMVLDPQKHISAMNSTYGDGFSEVGVSSYSDTERSSRTLVFRNGILACTRESRTYPTPQPNAAR